ncbi:hypothetical protein I307_01507 [Cryptococcus deuterogattii 99/473]|uniref:BHLH domain-containing protein n=1 Tax=Cryptococcus deuterogattii Ram5 TaxID=1296110 RepID=A0A0D0V3W8_9TREE|nr:hypothetical protein I313_04651 [Cryptococcus deuterogattii Ram5]KIY59255.1 hypothetical protein I307_01507 [Cryptococcus deuterogattii 99/473]
MPPQSSTATASNRKRKILPMARSQDSTPSSPSLSESSSLISDDGDEEYAPEPARSTRTAKRPRDNDFKSSTGGRSGLTTNSHGNGNRTGGGNNKTKGKGMSREQLRKVNHSLIERRRREKINAALNELRRMVPGLGENGGKCGEFKLEVLEKTVEHMKDLKGRLADLERAAAASVNNSSGESSARGKDKGTELVMQSRSQSKTSLYPSPSPDRQEFPNPHSPDPNETEVESNLPPPYTLASRVRARSPVDASPPRPTSAYMSTANHGANTSKESGSPSFWSGQAQEQVADHLHGQGQRGYQPLPSVRPKPPTSASNLIFLPFPTPSPTSPFLHPNISLNANPNADSLNCSSMMGSVMSGENEGQGTGFNSSSSAYASASANGSVPGGTEVRSIDPSPFLPPIPNMSLFNIMSLENSPLDSFRQACMEGVGSAGKSRSFSPPELNLEDQSGRRSSLTESKGVAGLGMSTMNTDVKQRQVGDNDKPTPIDGERANDKQQGGPTAKAGADTSANGEMLPEEAANLLLAFSSPETLRPLGDGSVVPLGIGQGYGQGQGQIRRTVEEFSLDSGATFGSKSGRQGKIGKRREVSSVKTMESTSKGRSVVGKSVRDILKMT